MENVVLQHPDETVQAETLKTDLTQCPIVELSNEDLAQVAGGPMISNQ